MNSCEQSPRTNGQPGADRRPTSSVGITSVGGAPHQDTDAEENQEANGLGHRSISLSTLPPTIIQPRMAQLETLEAKMASIEVSLSSSPRRKKNGFNGITLASSIRSIPKELALKELESLRNALRDKENIIQSLRGQLTVPGLRLNVMRNGTNGSTRVRELTETEKKQAEGRLSRLKTDVDNKRLAIKNLKMALERLDITDNIDVRIQQAELEYQLGREELNLLSLLEETRALQLCIEESNRCSLDNHTLYSCVEGSEYLLLQAIEVDYDPKGPRFGAGQRDSMPGLYIDWALEETQLRKDDRLIEVNGKIVINKSRDDLMRLLAAAPDPAQIVVLRKLPKNGELVAPATPSKELVALRSELEEAKDKAEEAQRIKESLRSDNIRLTHRISYLEEQVSELLTRRPPSDQEIRIVTPTPVISTVKSNQNITNINITSQSPASTPSSSSDVQVFQKGPQVTTLTPSNGIDNKGSSSPGYPIRSKSSLSNVSNTHISQTNGDYICQKGQHNRHKHRSSRSGVQSPLGSPVQHEKVTYRKHHHHREKDYSSETNSGTEHSNRYNRRNHDPHRYSADFAKANSEMEYSSDIMDQSYKKATKIVHELTRSRESALYEKHRQKCITACEKYNAEILRHYNARKSTSVLDFRSEVHLVPKYDSKSVEELDAVEPSKACDRVYKKIQDARSVKSLDFDSDCNSTRTSARVNGRSNTDYTSEPTSDKLCYETRPRPTPPKKPVRLSLHKTNSMQSVEHSDGQMKNERKCMKRNYKGEIPVFSYKPHELNGDHKDQYRWNFRKSMDANLENGSWC